MIRSIATIGLNLSTQVEPILSLISIQPICFTFLACADGTQHIIARTAVQHVVRAVGTDKNVVVIRACDILDRCESIALGVAAFAGLKIDREPMQFPIKARLFFVPIIGVAIGGTMTPEVLRDMARWWPSLLALVLFVPIAHAAGFTIFRRVGKLDPTTAWFASMPGGLIEAMLMGEQEGAVEHIVTLQQFLRIIFVVTLLPVGLSFWYGHPVGSSAGMTLSRADAGFEHLPEVAVLLVIGVLLGKYTPLPAGQLVGPLLVGAAAPLSGLAVIEMPPYMISAAQVVIGAFLGTRFHGIGMRMIARGAWLSFLSVGSMLLIGLGFSALAQGPTGEPIDVLLISFSPGGVTEMALIALSLSANPAFVSAHHIYRILLTVGLMRPFYRRFVRSDAG